MRVGSLFTGIGGLDLGLERAGMVVTWQVEIDQACRRVLERHWPTVPKYGDVRELTGGELEPVDLVCGGFPCQDVSCAGARAGLAGARSGLFFDFARLVGELRPTWVLVENVPGLLSSRGGRDFAIVLATLGDLGYGLAWRVLDARYFGVPQRRRRLFLVGRLGAPCPAEVLFEPESGPGDSAARGAAGQAVAPTLTASARVPRNWWNPALIAGTVTARDGKGPDSGGSMLVVLLGQTGANGSNVSDDGVAYTLDTTGRQVVAFNPIAAGSWRTSVVRAGDYAGAIGTRAHDAVLLGATVRRITPREAERLQGFPDDWTAAALWDAARYRLLGNAVTVPVAEWIGRRIMAVETGVRG